jgi:hypothetical protein
MPTKLSGLSQGKQPKEGSSLNEITEAEGKGTWLSSIERGKKEDCEGTEGSGSAFLAHLIAQDFPFFAA